MGIRRAIGIVGLLLPIILGPVGWLVFGIEIQDNMSSYYYTALRDVFVGAMCAIGIFLFCYRGYDWIESWTANMGCISALGVALCPLDANSDPLHQSSIVGYLHTISGGAFFSSLWRFTRYITSETDNLEGRLLYRVKIGGETLPDLCCVNKAGQLTVSLDNSHPIADAVRLLARHQHAAWAHFKTLREADPVNSNEKVWDEHCSQLMDKKRESWAEFLAHPLAQRLLPRVELAQGH